SECGIGLPNSRRTTSGREAHQNAERLRRLRSDARGGGVLSGAVPGGEPNAEVAKAMSHITEPEVLDLLTRLVEKSLVVYEEDEQGPGRYRLLESVRQYARDRLLESDDAGPLRERHRDHFL